MNEYPRETVEFQPVEVKSNGAEVTIDVMFAITKDGDRPETWTESETLGSGIGVTVAGLAPGDYRVWAKVSSPPETPVIDCGAFRIT